MSNPLKPFPPQVECIDAMVTALRTHGFVVNKSCTGTGKTLTTIETARILGLKPLVVCPAIVVTQWKRAMEAQGVVYAGMGEPIINFPYAVVKNVMFFVERIVKNPNELSAELGTPYNPTAGTTFLPFMREAVLVHVEPVAEDTRRHIYRFYYMVPPQEQYQIGRAHV